MQETLRLFLGVALDAQTEQAFRQFQTLQPKHEALRWIPAENWHLTLYFFGAVPVEQLDNLKALLSLGLQGQKAFSLDFDRYVLAPKPRQARMIWARYRKKEAFRDLVHHLHSLYRQIEPDLQMRYSPIPHITLARLRGAPPASLQLPADSPAVLPIRDVLLWESILTPAGSTYHPIQAWRLA